MPSRYTGISNQHDPAQRGCVIILVLALYVISTEGRNLLIITNCEYKIPRLSPRNDIVTQSQRAGLYSLINRTKIKVFLMPYSEASHP